MSEQAKRLKSAPIRLLRQADLLACSHAIVMPNHYRPDGSCRCDDPGHSIMQAWGYTWSELSKCWVSQSLDTDD